MHTNVHRRFDRLIIAAMLAGAGSASAQWSVTILNPASATGASAQAVEGGQQVGFLGFGGLACLWTGTASSVVDLHPDGASTSRALAVDEGKQAGWAVVDGVHSAAMWSGTKASWVNLHPASGQVSEANGIHGDQQVGYVRVLGDNHAAIWHGTAASFSDVHPADSITSALRDTDGTQQVGWADAGTGSPRAYLWTGTAASAIMLSPGGKFGPASECYAVADGEQVGWFDVGGLTRSASLWTGSAASWVNLHPAVAFRSYAYDCNDGEQVGAAQIDGAWHAGRWKGSAASWEDLHGFLPSTIAESYANGIWHEDGVTYVVGSAVEKITGKTFAVMWIEAPACPADCEQDGDLDVFDFLCFQSEWAALTPFGDCEEDGDWDVFDFLCFQSKFAAGC